MIVIYIDICGPGPPYLLLAPPLPPSKKQHAQRRRKNEDINEDQPPPKRQRHIILGASIPSIFSLTTQTSTYTHTHTGLLRPKCCHPPTHAHHPSKSLLQARNKERPQRLPPQPQFSSSSIITSENEKTSAVHKPTSHNPHAVPPPPCVIAPCLHPQAK